MPAAHATIMTFMALSPEGALSLGFTVRAASDNPEKRWQTLSPMTNRLTHLDRLEAESIFILRETVAAAAKPVMLYSMGKDSAVVLHVAKKAFFPGSLPFPLLHVDTTWKFRDMYVERDKVAAAHELIVYRNPEALDKGINPFDHGPLH